MDGQARGGDGEDKFRTRIRGETTGLTVYDNLMGTDDGVAPTTALGGGGTVIHKG